MSIRESCPQTTWTKRYAEIWPMNCKISGNMKTGHISARFLNDKYTISSSDGMGRIQNSLLVMLLLQLKT